MAARAWRRPGGCQEPRASAPNSCAASQPFSEATLELMNDRLEIKLPPGRASKVAPIDQMTLADRQFVLDVNLTGQFLCSREAIREFTRRGVREEVSCHRR